MRVRYGGVAVEAIRKRSRVEVLIAHGDIELERVAGAVGIVLHRVAWRKDIDASSVCGVGFG